MLSPPHRSDDASHAAIDRLTPKERECLDRWLSHATAKQIALELGVGDDPARVSVGEATGRPAGVSVWDEAGHLRALLAQGPGEDRESSVEFWDRDGSYRAGFGTWPDGATGTELGRVRDARALRGARRLQGRDGRVPRRRRSAEPVGRAR